MTGIVGAFFIYCVLQILWIIISTICLARRKDDLPLVASLFLFYIFSFRFWALLEGWVNPVNLSNFGFENVTFDSAIEAQALAVLGQSIFMLTYLWTQRTAIL